ncbi:acyl-CoA-binding domain-containing protein 5-like [Glandiceps talaboti]
MAANVERQFEAAVNVIKCLPKNVPRKMLLTGPFQPSYEMMKRFYGLYKQATEGPCDKSKPGFWDVVGRQKWDAWSKLGDMTKQQAMQCYVDELKKVFQKYSDPEKVKKMLEQYPESGKMMEMVHVYLSDPSPAKIKEIVETMPHTPEVSKFVNNLGPFFEAVQEGDDDEDENENREMMKLPNGDINDTHPLVVPPDMVITGGKDDDDDVLEDKESESEENEVDVEEEEEEEEEGEEDEEEEDGEEEEDEVGDEDGASGVDMATEEVSEENAVIIPETVTLENKAFVMEVKPTLEAVTKPSKKPKKESESEDENGFVRINGGINGTGHTTPLLTSPSITSDTDSGDEIFCDSVEKQNLEDNSEMPSLIALKSSSYNPTTSTPNKNSFTVQAEVYSEKPSVSFRSPEVSQIIDGKGLSDAVVARGGGNGGEGDGGQSGSQGRQRGSGATGQGSGRGTGRSEGQRSPSRTPTRPSGSSGGSGGRGGRQHSPPKGDVNEQIAVALERLQQDMNSVLIRLNTLETLSLRHQAEAQQSGMWSSPPSPATRGQSSSSWWPFNNLSSKTVFFIIVWPFVVSWVIKLLKRRRGHRS